MIRKWNRLANIAIVAGLLLETPVFAADTSRMLGSYDGVIRVHSNGKIEKIFSPAQTRFCDVSPDERYVAYSVCETKDCMKESFWVRDFQTQKDFKVADPPSLEYVTWSPDSKQMLIRRRYPTDNMNVGTYSIFNLDDKTTQPIEFPYQFAGWISKNKFILYSDYYFVKRKLHVYDSQTKKDRQVNPTEGIAPQYVREDGLNVVANHWIKKNETGSEYECEGVQINLASGEMTKLTPVIKECPIQLLYSPSGKSLGYIETNESRQGAAGIAGDLIIDGKSFRGIDEMIRGYSWIDDNTILVETTYKNTVWNFVSHKILSVTKIQGGY